MDIPGTYSIMSNSEEEEIARNYICFGNSDVTVIVIDATCLERNLNLVFQIMEITPNLIVCVNLLDEARKKGINIDLKSLSNFLGVPVIGTIARKKKTLDNLLEIINQTALNKNSNSIIKPITYNSIVEECIDILKNEVSKIPNIPSYLHRWVCLKLIDGDPSIISSIEKNFNIQFSTNIKLSKKLNDIQKLLNKYGITQENFKDSIVSKIIEKAENITKSVCSYKDEDYSSFDKKIDKILTSKKFGIPIMLLFLGIIFWITIIGANYPSDLLFNLFSKIQNKLINFAAYIHTPKWLSDMLILGVYQTLTWIISVMLPPMSIFFPLFTFLEDLGYLPRIAFNMDGLFKKAAASGKQMITMCMGFGCNAAGVVGSRIIDSPRERILATITNSFVPCNGRYPFLIAISTIFVAGSLNGFSASIVSCLAVIAVIILGIIMTLLISKILSKTLLKGVPSSFILELPPYRKPQIEKIIIRSIFDRTLFVLSRAIKIAAPAGLLIWLLANIGFNGSSLLSIIANFLDPFAKLMGLDGYILTAFLLGIPANEIVLPIILMCYLNSSYLTDISDTVYISQILINNGWTLLTAINVMIFTVLHFPCTTTLLSIKKETGSLKWTALSFILPTVCGISLCMVTTFIYNIFV